MKTPPIIDRETLRELFLRHYERTRDFDSCFDFLEEAIEARRRDASFVLALHRQPKASKPRSDLAMESPPVRAALKSIAKIAGLEPEDLILDTKRPVIVRWRNVAIWLLRQEGRSLTWIGRMFGSDHTFARYALRAAEALFVEDPTIRERILELLPDEDRRAAA